MNLIGNQRWIVLPVISESRGQRPSNDRTNRRRLFVPLRLLSTTAQVVATGAFSGMLFWLVSIYGGALRDARYLDGWILVAGMSVQLFFHIAIKSAKLSPKAAVRWRKVHIFCGYFLVAAFVSHCSLSLPDSGFEWSLWTSFVLVTLSGISGSYLAWSFEAKRTTGAQSMPHDLARRRAELAQDIRNIVEQRRTPGATSALPAPPYEAWVMDLYISHLRKFFAAPRNFRAHLIGSQLPVKRLTEEIENLARYVDQENQEKLALIKELVAEKDRLDFARVSSLLSKGWLYVHVPVTYALIVLTVLHVLVVYAYASRA